MYTGAPVSAFSLAAPPMWSIWAWVITMAFTVKSVPVQHFGNVRDIIARIDDDGLAGLLVAENRAVALQHADRKNLVNHTTIVYSGCGWGRRITLWSINHSVESLLPKGRKL